MAVSCHPAWYPQRVCNYLFCRPSLSFARLRCNPTIARSWKRRRMDTMKEAGGRRLHDVVANRYSTRYNRVIRSGPPVAQFAEFSKVPWGFSKLCSPWKIHISLSGKEYSLWWKFASREKPLRRKNITSSDVVVVSKYATFRESRKITMGAQRITFRHNQNSNKSQLVTSRHSFPVCRKIRRNWLCVSILQKSAQLYFTPQTP
jgi:hypothetical protein